MKIIFSVPLQSLLKAYGNIIIDNWLLYHKWDVVWSCLCRIDGRYACCLIYCHSRHMWFFEKNISRSNVRAVSVQPISFLFRKNKQFSSISRKCKMPFFDFRVRSTIHHALDLWLMTVLVLILPSTANHEGPLGSWAVVPLKTPFRYERLTEWDKVKGNKVIIK